MGKKKDVKCFEDFSAQEVRDLLDKHGSANEVGRVFGKSHQSVLRAARRDGVRVVLKRGRDVSLGGKSEHGKLSNKSSGKKKSQVKSLEEFRTLYDRDYMIPQRIYDGLVRLGDGWEYESEFAKIAGVRLSDLSDYRDQFTDFWLPINREGRRVWAGSKCLADQMRKMV